MAPEPPPSEPTPPRWWLLPLILGLIAAGLALTITEFVPRLQRYYTVL